MYTASVFSQSKTPISKPINRRPALFAKYAATARPSQRQPQRPFARAHTNAPGYRKRSVYHSPSGIHPGIQRQHGNAMDKACQKPQNSIFIDAQPGCGPLSTPAAPLPVPACPSYQRTTYDNGDLQNDYQRFLHFTSGVTDRSGTNRPYVIQQETTGTPACLRFLHPALQAAQNTAKRQYTFIVPPARAFNFPAMHLPSLLRYAPSSRSTAA